MVQPFRPGDTLRAETVTQVARRTAASATASGGRDATVIANDDQLSISFNRGLSFREQHDAQTTVLAYNGSSVNLPAMSVVRVSGVTGVNARDFTCSIIPVNTAPPFVCGVCLDAIDKGKTGEVVIAGLALGLATSTILTTSYASPGSSESTKFSPDPDAGFPVIWSGTFQGVTVAAVLLGSGAQKKSSASTSTIIKVTNRAALNAAPYLNLTPPQFAYLQDEDTYVALCVDGWVDIAWWWQP